MRFASRVENVPPYLFVEISRKISQRRAEGADVVSFAIGDPDSCIASLEQYEALGVEGFMCSMQQGPTTHEEAMTTLRLFGKYVIPHFQEKEKRAKGRTREKATDN